MLRHHFNARRTRLERLIAKAEACVAELSTTNAQTAVGKRTLTMALRSLERRRKSLSTLIELHGAEFSAQDPEI